MDKYFDKDPSTDSSTAIPATPVVPLSVRRLPRATTTTRFAGGGNAGSTSYGNDVNSFAGDLVQHIQCTVTPTSSSAAASSACTGTQTRLNTSSGAINYAYNAAVANYDGAIASGRGRFARSGFVTVSYTLGHSLDDWQNYPVGYPTNQFYANSPYDVRHRLSVGVSYELPGSHFSNGLEKRALCGWALLYEPGLRSFKWVKTRFRDSGAARVYS